MLKTYKSYYLSKVSIWIQNYVEISIEAAVDEMKDTSNLTGYGVDDLVDLSFSEDLDYTSDEELTKTVPTVFRWENGGNEVFLSGSFTDWNARIPMSARYRCTVLLLLSLLLFSSNIAAHFPKKVVRGLIIIIIFVIIIIITKIMIIMHTVTTMKYQYNISTSVVLSLKYC